MTMRSWGTVCAALLALSSPAPAWAGDSTLEGAWDLFNGSRHSESAALCKELLGKFPDDPEKTPAILLLTMLNYDHLAGKSDSAEDQAKAKTAAETITTRYPTSRSAAEAYFYLGELYSGNVPVKIETDCGKAMPMFLKALEKAGKQWIKDESYKGMERCKAQPLSDAAQKLYDIREYELALPVFMRIVGKYPKSASAQYSQMMVGLCYEGMGKLDQALTAYEDCIKDYKPYPGDTLFYYYAVALDIAGRGKEAKGFYNKVIGDPASQPWAVRSAKEKLAELKLGGARSAESMLDALVTVKLKDAPITSLLDSISEQTRANFILREGLEKNTVTAEFSKAAAKDILNKTLSAQGLALHRVGQTDLYLIMRADQGVPTDPGAGIQDPNLEKRVSLTFRGVPLSVFLDAVAAQTGLKFGMSEEISQLKTTAFLKNVSAREALAMAAMIKGLTYKRNVDTGAYDFSRAK